MTLFGHIRELLYSRKQKLKPCQAEFLLSRKYNPNDKSVLYCCRNNMAVCIDSNSVTADNAAMMDSKVLYSLLKKGCCDTCFNHNGGD